MRVRSLILTLVMALAITLPALAQDGTRIFLNGVDITGATDIELTDIDKVEIDASGNVIITAPQYQVETEGSANAGGGNTGGGNTGGGNANAGGGNTGNTGGGSVQPVTSGEYFLIASNTSPGKAQYDIDVFVNGVLRRTVRNDEDQVVVNITKHLVKGTNTLVFKARKSKGPRVSTAATDRISIMIGLGNATANQLTIERQVASFTANAAETKDKQQTITLEVP